MEKIKSIAILPVLLLIVCGSMAQVKPNSIFSDNMVLQRQAVVPVWGTASEGEKVVVQFMDQKIETITKNGKWKVSLQPLKAGGPFSMSIIGSNTIILNNILVGEVWLCTGQSNMERALHYDTSGKEAIANSTNSMLRMVSIPHNSKDTPQENIACQWVVSNPKNTTNFSATAYWFGSKLQKQLGVPVGLINSSFGGTTIECWVSKEVLENLQLPKDKNTDPVMAKADYDERAAKVKPLLDKYIAEKNEARQQGKPSPVMPGGMVGDYRGPNVLYNGMIAPLANYCVKGMIWYQGENNAGVGRANTYYQLLPALIKQWRTDWQNKNLPFLVVQLTPFRKKTTNPNLPSGIATVSDAQRLAFDQPNTAVVVTTDLSEPDGDVHYKRKEPLGDRLLLAAKAIAYGEKIEYSGPLYKDVKFIGDKATVGFTHIGGGLVAKDGVLSGFTISGDDKVFYAADAKIVGDKVIVSNPSVTNPKAVRYGWADNPTVNLWNKAGLPAAIFRTDNWDLPNK